jgi:hypothetical protein
MEDGALKTGEPDNRIKVVPCAVTALLTVLFQELIIRYHGEKP